MLAFMNNLVHTVMVHVRMSFSKLYIPRGGDRNITTLPFNNNLFSKGTD